MMRKSSEEASRGALKAVHASAGLARSASPEAAALLRAAEGLVRAAIAVLQAPGCTAKGATPLANASAVPEPHAKPPGGGCSRSARRRRRRRLEKEVVVEASASGGEQVPMDASVITSAVVASCASAAAGTTSARTSDQDLAGGDSEPLREPLPRGPLLQASHVPQPGYPQQFVERMQGLPQNVARDLWRDCGFADGLLDEFLV